MWLPQTVYLEYCPVTYQNHFHSNFIVQDQELHMILTLYSYTIHYTCQTK